MEFLCHLCSSLIMWMSVTVTIAEPSDMAKGCTIVIDKPASALYVVSVRGDTLATYPVALGQNLGQKIRPGDRKTPEGEFSIVSIEDSRGWEGDASGSDYGPWFMRLGGGKWHSIGIHGTNRPETIGHRASLGCIRLENSDLEKLHSMVRKGTRVTILPDTAQTPVPPAYKAKSHMPTKAYYKAKLGKTMKTHKATAGKGQKASKHR